MGYTIGRKLTGDFIYSVAKKYKTRSEFQKGDASVYRTARIRGILDAVTKHMINVSFSIPQLVCRDLLDRLLGAPSLYNTRKIVPPYEIDIYYPSLQIAVEYDGKGWHNGNDVKCRDETKSKLLAEKGIFLLKFVENNRDYEEDIKAQMSSNSEFLQKTGLSPDVIKNCKVSWDKVYSATTIEDRIAKITIIINNCSSSKQFRTQFPKEYSFVISNKLNYLLKNLPKLHREYTDQELLDIALRYDIYSDFVKTKYYQTCFKRDMLSMVCEHMTKNYQEWKDVSNSEIEQMVIESKCDYASDLKLKFKNLYYVVKRRKLKVWTKGRKIKNNPLTIKQYVKDFIDSGLTMGEIKKFHPRIYSSYQFNKKKGNYEQKAAQSPTERTT